MKIGDRVIHPKGSLLTLNAQEATEKINGKPVLAEGIAESLPDLVQDGGIERRRRAVRAERVRATRFLADRARAALIVRRNSRRLHRVQDSRFRLGGHHLRSSVLRSFFSDTILPGWPAGKWSGFSSSGLFSSCVEILFFGHSTIVFGVVGVLLMFASLLWAMVDRYPGQKFFPTGQMLKIPLLNMLLTFVAAAVLIAILARFLPQTSIYRRFILSTTNPPGPSLEGAPRVVCHVAPARAGNARTLPHDSAAKREGGIRESRRGCGDRRRIHRAGNPGHDRLDGRHAGRGQGSRRVIRASASQLTRTVFTYLTLLLVTLCGDLSPRRLLWGPGIRQPCSWTLHACAGWENRALWR